MNNDNKYRETVTIIRAGRRRRYRAERRFRYASAAATGLALLFLALLLGNIAHQALPAFHQARIRLTVTFSPARITDNPDRGDYSALIHEALYSLFPAVSGRRQRRKLVRLVSRSAAAELRRQVLANPGLIGRQKELWLTAAAVVDHWLREPDAAILKLSPAQRHWLQELKRQHRLARPWNWNLFICGDSRDPEAAGILGALVGSLLTLLVTLTLTFPLGVAAALYLEEFAPQTPLTDFLEININNLAAVPSIIFGLLGLMVFINLFGLPRSASLVGGLVLSLMTLPTIIITSRAALKAVPPSLREAALALGASRLQMVFHHLLPRALPGILTGAIIGLARALGETAPLLMIGMVAFIVDIPRNLTDPATVLPVQIYLWADSPERAFVARTAAAIIVLLGFLIAMNSGAVWLRHRYEKRG